MFRLLLAAAAFIFAVLSARWFEEGDYYDPIRQRRHCGAPPAAINAWSVTGRTRKPDDASNLERWLEANPGSVNELFGAFCRSALHNAATFGREDLATLLTARSADVRTGADPTGDTPLHIAAQYGDIAVARVLVDKGADVGAGNRYGRTPLHDAVAGLGGTSDLEGRLAIARLLISRGANVQARDRGGRTPLDEAVGSSVNRVNSDRMTQLLLNAGASPRSESAQRDSPLQQAAGLGNLAVVQQLLDRGEDPNTAGRDTTPLGAAAFQGRADVVTLLLDRGADASRVVRGSRLEGDGAPLAMALMPQRGEPRDGDAHKLQIARLLIDHSADVNASDREGRTALHRAASRGQLRVVELLTTHRAAIDPVDALGVTPLQLAVKDGHAAVAAYLLDQGADVRLRARDGTTALELSSHDREMEALVRRYARR